MTPIAHYSSTVFSIALLLWKQCMLYQSYHVAAVSVISRRQKGAATKVNVSYPAVVKIYSHGMGGVDLMDQYTAVYRLDRRARFRFHFENFFRPMRCWLCQFLYCPQSNLPQKARIMWLQDCCW